MRVTAPGTALREGSAGLLDDPTHWKPTSTWQTEEHPSPSSALPSSQFSICRGTPNTKSEKQTRKRQKNVLGLERLAVRTPGASPAESPPPVPLVLSGHAASLTPY